MNKWSFGVLVAAGLLVLVVVAAGTVFYVKIYQPIGSPLVAMAGASRLEERRLQNQAAFVPPASGELTGEQTADFVAVEEEVQKRLAVGTDVLVRKQADLERASKANTLSVQKTLLAFGDMKGLYLSAKAAQIEAMNRVDFSKVEFEWVRKQLYQAAGLRLSQLDVSDVIAGVPDAVVKVREFERDGRVPGHNERLARPLASKLQAWLSLGFFGL